MLLNFLFCYYFSIHGGIEVNPGPKTKISEFSYCHWNVNSILAHNKLSLITAYNTGQEYATICVSENYLDSSANGYLLLITGYDLLRTGHPNNLRNALRETYI